MLFIPWLMQVATSAVASLLVAEVLKQSGKGPVELRQPKIQGEKAMSGYDLVGAELMGLVAGLDDDFAGSIGASDDESFLQSLSVSGFPYQVSGSGMTEIIGAAEARGAQKALNAIKAKKGMAVVQQTPSRRRKMPLGFVPTTVAASGTATIPAAPQNIFRAERLMIPSDIAFDLGVTDLKVGNQSQFAQTGEVPAVLFSEVAINTGVEFDTAEVGNQVSAAVRNKDTVNDVVFTAAAVGTVAK